jgi:hypothetical protein
LKLLLMNCKFISDIEGPKRTKQSRQKLYIHKKKH